MPSKHRQETKRITLNAVAERAGVSISTASLVLSGKARERRISDDVHTRVERAARELDYTPNLLVKSMQSGSTGVISFFNGFRNRRVNDLYMDQLSTAVERAAGDRGYDVLVHCDFKRTSEQIYRSLNGGRSDGLLFFAPMQNDPLLTLLSTSRLHTVLINSNEIRDSLTCVTEDIEHGLSLLAERFAMRGHKRILLLGDENAHNAEPKNRVKLLQHKLCEHGINADNSDVLLVDEYNMEPYLAEILARLKAPGGPTAIFCWHDLLGYRLLDNMQNVGINIPDSVAVAGYDGLHWPCRSHHLLTSVKVDLASLATECVDILLAQLQGKKCEQRVVKIPVSIFEGTTL